MARSKVKEFSNIEAAIMIEKLFPEQGRVDPSWVSRGKREELWKPHGRNKSRGNKKYTIDDVVVMIAARKMFKSGMSLVEARKALPLLYRRIRQGETSTYLSLENPNNSVQKQYYINIDKLTRTVNKLSEL